MFEEPLDGEARFGRAGYDRVRLLCESPAGKTGWIHQDERHTQEVQLCLQARSALRHEQAAALMCTYEVRIAVELVDSVLSLG
jgi:hypothetical protein